MWKINILVSTIVVIFYALLYLGVLKSNIPSLIDRNGGSVSDILLVLPIQITAIIIRQVIKRDKQSGEFLFTGLAVCVLSSVIWMLLMLVMVDHNSITYTFIVILTMVISIASLPFSIIPSYFLCKIFIPIRVVESEVLDDEQFIN